MGAHTFAKLKRKTSIRGIVMLAASAVVAGVAIATLSYKPAPPPGVPDPPRATTVALVPGPPPGPVESSTVAAPVPLAKPVVPAAPTPHPTKTKTP